MEKTNIITEILEAFRIFDGNYKREQVDSAIELKEKVRPRKRNENRQRLRSGKIAVKCQMEHLWTKK